MIWGVEDWECGGRTKGGEERETLGAKQCCQKVVMGGWIPSIRALAIEKKGGGGEGAKGARLAAKGSEGQCEGGGDRTARDSAWRVLGGRGGRVKRGGAKRGDSAAAARGAMRQTGAVAGEEGGGGK